MFLNYNILNKILFVKGNLKFTHIFTVGDVKKLNLANEPIILHELKF
jgi:hypothetical protein